MSPWVGWRGYRSSGPQPPMAVAGDEGRQQQASPAPPTPSRPRGWRRPRAAVSCRTPPRPSSAARGGPAAAATAGPTHARARAARAGRRPSAVTAKRRTRGWPNPTRPSERRSGCGEGGETPWRAGPQASKVRAFLSRLGFRISNTPAALGQRRRRQDAVRGWGAARVVKVSRPETVPAMAPAPSRTRLGCGPVRLGCGAGRLGSGASRL